MGIIDRLRGMKLAHAFSYMSPWVVTIVADAVRGVEQGRMRSATLKGHNRLRFCWLQEIRCILRAARRF